MAERWRRCSACKKDIALGGVHWVCSVSTCNRARTALVFCSVDCWEIHLPTERHREAWAVEARTPKVPDPQETGPRMRTTTGHGPVHAPGEPPKSPGPASSKPPAASGRDGGGVARAAAESGQAAEARSSPTDVLVVASKLKTYVREGSGFNTSDRVMLVLSDVLRRYCDEAMRNARRSGRDTVLDRDVPDRPPGR